MRLTAERYTPEAAESLGQQIVGLYHRYAYTAATESLSHGQRVLDIGFGDGFGSEILRRAGAEYVGVEVDAEAIAHARKRYPGDFRLYDGVALPQESFDLVVCFQVIEHLQDPDPLLAQISDLGCPALFTTPNRELRLDPGEKPWNRFHVREFSRDDLQTVLERHFGIVKVSFIRAPERMEDLELARIDRARKLARLDIFKLRYLLPEGVDTKLRARLRPPDQPISDLSLDDFRFSRDPGLDLFAVAGPLDAYPTRPASSKVEIAARSPVARVAT
jgi:SAM-dependent methyltransferase